jgi:hypothetical protein
MSGLFGKVFLLVDLVIKIRQNFCRPFKKSRLFQKQNSLCLPVDEPRRMRPNLLVVSLKNYLTVTDHLDLLAARIPGIYIYGGDRPE